MLEGIEQHEGEDEVTTLRALESVSEAGIFFQGCCLGFRA